LNFTAGSHNLKAACAAAEGPVAALFLVCADQWREHDWGRPRADFLRRTVARLGADLAALNIPLLVREAGTFAAAPAAVVARRIGAPLDRALVGQAALALQEELLALPAALLALWSCVSCH